MLRTLVHGFPHVFLGFDSEQSLSARSPELPPLFGTEISPREPQKLQRSPEWMGAPFRSGVFRMAAGSCCKVLPFSLACLPPLCVMSISSSELRPHLSVGRFIRIVFSSSRIVKSRVLSWSRRAVLRWVNQFFFDESISRSLTGEIFLAEPKELLFIRFEKFRKRIYFPLYVKKNPRMEW